MGSTIEASLLEPLGRLTEEFNALEEMVAFTIWMLIGADQRTGQIVTERLNFAARVDLLEALGRHRLVEGEKVVRLETLVRRARHVGARRDHFVHALWLAGPSKGQGHTLRNRMKGSQGVAFSFAHVTAEEILATVNEADQLAIDITDIV